MSIGLLDTGLTPLCVLLEPPRDAAPRATGDRWSRIAPALPVTFYGQSTHQLDPKGRLCLPKRIHALIGEDASRERTVWLTRGTGGCLWLFTPVEFEKKAAALPDDPFAHEAIAAVEREFWASAFQAKLDGSNRVLVPDELRLLAGLAPSSEVVVIGMRSRVELWSTAARQRVRLSSAEYDERAPVVAGANSAAKEAQGVTSDAFHSILHERRVEQLKNLGVFDAPNITAPPALKEGDR